MKKRAIALLLAFSLISLMGLPASVVAADSSADALYPGAWKSSGFVDNLNEPLPPSTYSDENVTVEQVPYVEMSGNGFVDILTESLTRTQSKPKDQWNWGSGIYEGGISDMLVSSLYTNYTFQPHADGWLIFSGTFFRSYPPSVTVTVALYRADNDAHVLSFSFPTGYYDTDSPGTACKWTGLDPHKTYYIKLTRVGTEFEPYNKVSGSLHVRIVP